MSFFEITNVGFNNQVLDTYYEYYATIIIDMLNY